MSRELLYDLRPLNIDPITGNENIVSRDSIISSEHNDGSIQIERRADRLPLDRFISGEYVNLAAYALRARDWTMVSGAAAVANEIPSPWGRDRCDMIAMAADAADGISQDITTEADTYNFSAYAKLDTGTGNIRLSNGTPGSDIAINSTSWTRVDGNFSCSAGSTTFSIINGSGGTAQNVYFWGMQVTKSKFPLRLVFGSNINKTSKPLEFEDAAWTKTNLTPDDDAGSNGVDVRVGAATSKLTATANNGMAASATFAVVAGDTVQSCLTLKKSSGSGDVMLTFGDASDYADLAIDLDAGTVTTSAEVDITIINSEIIILEDGWYRVNMRVHCEAAIAAAFTEIILATSGDVIDVDVCYGYILEYDESCMLTEPADTTGLVSSYLYDNDEGVNDNTGDNDGTNDGAVLQGDGGASFDGTAKITVADNDTLDITGAITIVCLFKLNNITANQMLISKFWDGLKRTWYIRVNGTTGVIEFTLSKSDGTADLSIQTSHVVVPNKMYCVLLTSAGAGGAVHCYLNGVDADTSWTKTGTIAANTHNVDIGAYWSGAVYNYYVYGYIREVNIYNSYKTSAQALSRYSEIMNLQPVYSYPEVIAAESSAYTSDDTDVVSSMPLSSGDILSVAGIVKRPVGGGIDDSREDGVLCSVLDAAGDNGVKLFLDLSETKISYCTRTGGSDDTLLSLDDSDVNDAIDNGEAVALFAMSYNGASIVAAFTESNFLSGGELAFVSDSNDRALPANVSELCVGSANSSLHIDGCIPCLCVEKVLAQQGRLVDEALHSLRSIFMKYLQQVV